MRTFVTQFNYAKKEMVLAVNINAPADTQITELIDWMKWFLIN